MDKMANLHLIGIITGRVRCIISATVRRTVLLEHVIVCRRVATQAERAIAVPRGAFTTPVGCGGSGEAVVDRKVGSIRRDRGHLRRRCLPHISAHVLVLLLLRLGNLSLALMLPWAIVFLLTVLAPRRRPIPHVQLLLPSLVVEMVFRNHMRGLRGLRQRPLLLHLPRKLLPVLSLPLLLLLPAEYLPLPPMHRLDVAADSGHLLGGGCSLLRFREGCDFQGNKSKKGLSEAISCSHGRRAVAWHHLLQGE